MSDVRIPQTSRVDSTPNGSPSRVGAETSSPSTGGSRVLQAPSDVATRQAGRAITSQGARELATAPPSTPMSRLTAGALDTTAAARSFIENLHALRFESTNDS